MVVLQGIFYDMHGHAYLKSSAKNKEHCTTDDEIDQEKL